MVMIIRQSQCFPDIATIDSIYRPVSLLLERLTGKRPTADDLSPLDAYLLHLILEFCPSPITVGDLAVEGTQGITSLVCLRNKNVVKVVASVSPDHALRARSEPFEGLDGLVSQEVGKRKVLSFVDEPAKITAHLNPEDLAIAAFPVFLIDPAALGNDLNQTLERIFEAYPSSLVLVLSVGRVGACRILDSLVRNCCIGSPLRLWLLREASGALQASRLALVAPSDLGFVRNLILRVEQLFDTNYDFLRLVHDSCMYAVELGLRGQSEVEIPPGGSRPDANAQELELAQEQLSVTQQQLSVTQQQLSVTQQQLSVTQQQLSVTQQQLSITEGELSIARQRLNQEYSRPVARTLALQTGRRFAQFVRRHRSVLVPAGSRREWFARKVMRAQRSLRGKAA
jgi:hypothetical protein